MKFLLLIGIFLMICFNPTSAQAAFNTAVNPQITDSTAEIPTHGQFIQHLNNAKQAKSKANRATNISDKVIQQTNVVNELKAAKQVLTNMQKAHKTSSNTVKDYNKVLGSTATSPTKSISLPLGHSVATVSVGIFERAGLKKVPVILKRPFFNAAGEITSPFAFSAVDPSTPLQDVSRQYDSVSDFPDYPNPLNVNP